MRRLSQERRHRSARSLSRDGVTDTPFRFSDGSRSLSTASSTAPNVRRFGVGELTRLAGATAPTPLGGRKSRELAGGDGYPSAPLAPHPSACAWPGSEPGRSRSSSGFDLQSAEQSQRIPLCGTENHQPVPLLREQLCGVSNVGPHACCRADLRADTPELGEERSRLEEEHGVDYPGTYGTTRGPRRTLRAGHNQVEVGTTRGVEVHKTIALAVPL